MKAIIGTRETLSPKQVLPYNEKSRISVKLKGQDTCVFHGPFVVTREVTGLDWLEFTLSQLEDGDINMALNHVSWLYRNLDTHFYEIEVE